MKAYYLLTKRRLPKVLRLKSWAFGPLLVFREEDKELFDEQLSGVPKIVLQVEGGLNEKELVRRDLEKIESAVAKATTRPLRLIAQIKSLKQKYKDPEVLRRLDDILREVIDKIIET